MSEGELGGATKIDVHNVTKTYSTYKKLFIGYEEISSVVALDGVSFQVKAGEAVSIIGPSGCGKTTLLKIIAGLARHDKGDVLVDGKLLDGPNSSAAMVFQNISLLPWRTAMRNVLLAFELRYHRQPTTMEKRRAQEIIEQMGLSGFENSYPHQLSGGMQQRVGLARALVLNPETILLDEPFGALDAQTRLLLQEQLLDVLNQRKDMMAVLVTHDIEEAIYLSDRVLVMTKRPGRIKNVFDVTVGSRGSRSRSDKEMVRLRNEIWDTLRSEVAV